VTNRSCGLFPGQCSQIAAAWLLTAATDAASGSRAATVNRRVRRSNPTLGAKSFQSTDLAPSSLTAALFVFPYLFRAGCVSARLLVLVRWRSARQVGPRSTTSGGRVSVSLTPSLVVVNAVAHLAARVRQSATAGDPKHLRSSLAAGTGLVKVDTRFDRFHRPIGFHFPEKTMGALVGEKGVASSRFSKRYCARENLSRFTWRYKAKGLRDFACFRPLC
jgi:hypothetical protein